MGAGFGFLVSDSVAFWRCRELVAAGKLKIRGELGNIADAELRRAEQSRRFQLIDASDSLRLNGPYQSA